MEKSEFWCYGKNETLKICPICNKPIYSGAIMVEHWHAECYKKSPVIMQRWIPVTDDLPKDNLKVFVSTETAVGIAAHNELGWYLSDAYFDGVIAWMPLPEPYKAESEGV